MSKVMKCTRRFGALNGALLEEVECFKYLGSKITVDEGIETEVKSRMNDIGKVLGEMKKVFSCRAMGMNVKRRLYEGVAVPTVLYGAETWSMAVEDREEIKVNGDEVSEESV